MGLNNTITVVGAVSDPPELRVSQSGIPSARFSVAWERRRRDQENEVTHFNVVCLHQMARNVEVSLEPGDVVVVYGTLQWNSWRTPDGAVRGTQEIFAEHVALSLRDATAVPGDNAEDRSRADRSHLAEAV